MMVNKPDLLPCWYVKDYADGWMKFYDVDCAIAEAKNTGAIMVYSENALPPDLASTPNKSAEVDLDALKREIETLRPPSEYTHGYTSGYMSGKWDAFDRVKGHLATGKGGDE